MKALRAHEHFCWRCYPERGGHWKCREKPCVKLWDTECPKHNPSASRKERDICE